MKKRSFKLNFTTLKLVFLFVMIRLLFVVFPFWGLEYEDSFVYNDTGRFLNYSYDFETTPYKCQSCAYGSYVNCEEFNSYGGHLLTLPIILAFMNKMIGYRVLNVFVVNFVFSIASLFLLIHFQKRHGVVSRFSVKVFVLLMIVTPFVSIFNTSGLTETLSVFFVLCFLLNIYKLSEKDFNYKSTFFLFSLLFLLMSIITKRENLILIFFIFLIPLIRKAYQIKPFIKDYFLFLIFSIASTLILAISFGVLGIEKNESVDIGSKTFSVMFLLKNVLQLFLAMIDPFYWGLTGLAFIMSVLLALFSKRSNIYSAFLFVLIILYIGVYSSHYRSYYQVVFNDSDPFDTLRYSVNYVMLIILFIHSISGDYVEQLYRRTFHSVSSKLLLILFFMTLVSNTIFTRLKLHRLEDSRRIQPVMSLLRITKADDIIITDIPMIFRAYTDESQNVIDVYTLENLKLDSLVNDRGNSDVYVLLRSDYSNDFDRFGIDLDFSKFKSVNLLSEEFLVLKSNDLH